MTTLLRHGRRTIAVLLSLVLLSAVFSAYGISSAAGVFTHNLNGTNVSRGTDQMIVYDAGPTTNTNEWGYEVTVGSDGVVTKVGGNNSEVPAGGFVVSGHGASASWLKTFAHVGMYCFYNTFAQSVAFSKDPIEETYSYDLKLTGVNTQRITDALILYNRDWGTATRTNEWGFEVCVSAEGRITSVGGNNNAIPAGGFVLSAPALDHHDLSGLLSFLGCQLCLRLSAG